MREHRGHSDRRKEVARREREWSEREAISVVRWFVDQGVSGGSELGERPNLVAALNELRAAGAGVLVVAKRDRLARDVAVCVMIDRAVAASGSRVVSADGIANGVGAADDLLRVMLDGVAAYVRADRFSEGSFAACVESGVVLALLARVEVLAREPR